MTTTWTAWTKPLERSAAEVRQQEIAFAQEKLHFYEDGVAKWRPILQALRSTTSTRAKPGNGARPARKATRRKTIDAGTIQTFMRPGAPYQSSQLAKSLSASPNSVLRRLKEMERVGMVRRTGTGSMLRWMLA